MVKVRATLALVVLALFPVVVVALLAAVVAVAVLAFRYSGVAGTKILLYLGVPLVLAVAVAVRDVARARPEPSPLPDLPQAEHPALWAEVQALASGLGTPAPSRIVVAPVVNAAVREVRGEREMTLGLPLLVGLTVPELRSVLGHELGHYGAGHTRLLRLTYRATDAVLGTVHNSSGLLHWLLARYARLYLAVAATANRAQEEEADGYSARVAGPKVAADAMRMVAALDHAWDALTAEYLPLAGPARRRPRVCEGLQELMRARAGHLEDVVTLAEAVAVPLRGDSHPPLGQRVARFEALAAAPSDEAPDGRDIGDPAWTLLSGEWRAVEALERRLLDDPDPEASWPELVRLAGAEVAARTAGHLVRAAQVTGVAQPTLAGFLDALEAGAGPRLATPLVNPALPPQERSEAARLVLTELLAAVVVDSLVSAGQAHHRLDWGGPWHVVVGAPDGTSPLDGEQLDAEGLVADAVIDPSSVPALRARLEEIGAPMDHAAAVSHAADPEPVGLITRARDRRATATGRKAVDVLVCDTGLLVVPSPRTSLLGSGLRHAVGGPDTAARRRAEELVAVPHAERLAAPGARWIDTDDIRAARLARRPWGWTLRIRLTGREELVMRSTSDTGNHGRAYPGLGALLGARVDSAAWAAAR